MDKEIFPIHYPLLLATIGTLITFIFLSILDNFLVTQGIIPSVFGWTILLSLVIFFSIYIKLRSMSRDTQLKANKEITSTLYQLMVTPSQSSSKILEYAEKLDTAYKNLERLTKLNADEYFRWADVKTRINNKEEAVVLLYLVLSLNPNNEEALWKLVFHLRSLKREFAAIKYLDDFTGPFKDSRVKSLWKAMIYELRYPKEAKMFYKESIQEEINLESLDCVNSDNYVKDLIGSFEEPELLTRHKDAFNESLGDYWDLISSTFPDATIMEKYYVLKKVQEKYEMEWLRNRKRFS